MSTKCTRLIRWRGVEAAGRGGAGKRTVRQQDPTWALRCPAFPSLKYYSVRVERGERKSRGTPARTFATVFTPLSTHSRHPLVVSFICSFALTEGLLLRADVRVVIYFFRSFVRPIVTEKRGRKGRQAEKQREHFVVTGRRNSNVGGETATEDRCFECVTTLQVQVVFFFIGAESVDVWCSRDQIAGTGKRVLVHHRANLAGIIRRGGKIRRKT